MSMHCNLHVLKKLNCFIRAFNLLKTASKLKTTPYATSLSSKSRII